MGDNKIMTSFPGKGMFLAERKCLQEVEIYTYMNIYIDIYIYTYLLFNPARIISFEVQRECLVFSPSFPVVAW